MPYDVIPTMQAFMLPGMVHEYACVRGNTLRESYVHLARAASWPCRIAAERYVVLCIILEPAWLLAWVVYEFWEMRCAAARLGKMAIWPWELSAGCFLAGDNLLARVILQVSPTIDAIPVSLMMDVACVALPCQPCQSSTIGMHAVLRGAFHYQRLPRLMPSWHLDGPWLPPTTCAQKARGIHSVGGAAGPGPWNGS